MTSVAETFFAHVDNRVLNGVDTLVKAGQDGKGRVDASLKQ
jgi:hypothetical protein